MVNTTEFILLEPQAHGVALGESGKAIAVLVGVLCVIYCFRKESRSPTASKLDEPQGFSASGGTYRCSPGCCIGS